MLKIPAPCRRLQTVYYQLHFFNPAHQKAMRTFAQNRVEFERSKEAYLWGVNPIKMFSKNSQSIKTYIKENKPDFNKESDLKKIFSFCTNVH